MTTLIVGGCSYTDPNYVMYKKQNIETWPSLLAKHYGYNLVNTATSGYGNRHIVNSVIDAILDYEMKDDIIVCVAWTEPYRLSFIDDTDLDHPIFLFSDEEYERRKTFSDGLSGYFDFVEEGRQQLIKYIKKRQKKVGSKDDIKKIISLNSKIVSQSFRNIWYLQDFCRNRNIEMFHMHTFDPYHFDKKLGVEMYIGEDSVAEKITSEYATREIEQSVYFRKVKDDVGYMGPKYNLYNDISEQNLFIDDNGKPNYHPNQKGHEWISDTFREFIDLGDRLENHTENSYRDILYLWE